MRTEYRIMMVGSPYLSGRGFDNVRRAVIRIDSQMNAHHGLLRLTLLLILCADTLRGFRHI